MRRLGQVLMEPQAVGTKLSLFGERCTCVKFTADISLQKFDFFSYFPHLLLFSTRKNVRHAACPSGRRSVSVCNCEKEQGFLSALPSARHLAVHLHSNTTLYLPASYLRDTLKRSISCGSGPRRQGPVLTRKGAFK